MNRIAFRSLLLGCVVVLGWSSPQMAVARHTQASSAAAAGQSEAPAARPADVASMDAIIKAVYDVISGPKGQKRDWDRMRSLFVPGARLIPTRADKDGVTQTTILSVDDYIRRSSPHLEGMGFFERESHRTAERFGAIAQVFSTYESRRAAGDAKPFQRGINSFQLLNDGHRWWVVTIYWQAEGPGMPIPKQYGG
ncbi:MAG: hypothetical protein ABI379_10120 [Rhodanobacter sp.]